MARPYCIGLTGGIGCGKTSVTRVFRELGAAVVDTDEIAHELTGPGGEAMDAIRREFGREFSAADGSLDRARMRRLAFSDPQARARLEAILHPLIRAQSRSRLNAATQPYALVVVPLLFETGAYGDLLRRVLVVDCDESQQIERTMRRSNLTEGEVRAIIAAQVSRKERIVRADDVLNNDGDMSALRKQVEALHAKYLLLARDGDAAAAEYGPKSPGKHK
jgi:dephospho-CoA kinase